MKNKKPALVIDIEEYSSDKELYRAIGASLLAMKMFREYRMALSDIKNVRPGPGGFSETWLAKNLSPRDAVFEDQIWGFFLQLLRSKVSRGKRG